MLLISVRDSENNRWKRDAKKKIEKNKQRQKRTKGGGGGWSYRGGGRAKWFCCAFKLGFLQLLCKTSLIFKSNVELALSVLLKQRELHESKHLAVECRCLKI